MMPSLEEGFYLGHDPMPDWWMDLVSDNTVTLHNHDSRYSGGPDYAEMKTATGNRIIWRGQWVSRDGDA
jgi:hypothetical protein